MSTDWLVTSLGFLTVINPFLYSYFNVKIAAWNNLSVGALVWRILGGTRVAHITR